MPFVAVLAALSAVLVWGYAFLGNRILLDHLDHGPAAAMRYVITALSLLPVLLWRRVPLPKLRDLPHLLVAGVIGIALYSELLMAGQARSSVSVASVLVQLAPLFAVMGAWIVSGERPSRWTWIGMGVALVGVAVISDLDPRHLLDSSGLGVLMLVGAAACWGIYQVALKPLFPDYGVLNATIWALFIGTAVLAIVHGMELARALPGLPSAGWIHGVALGLGAGTVGFIAWSFALSRAATGRVTSFLFLVPVVAIFFAHGWRGEAITTTLLAGGALIVLGVALANRRSSAVAKPR